jgi:hypothetical protein
MNITEIQKLKEIGFTLEQIEEMEVRYANQVGFRALVQMMLCLQDLKVPFSQVVDAWQLAAVTRCAQ